MVKPPVVVDNVDELTDLLASAKAANPELFEIIETVAGITEITVQMMLRAAEADEYRAICATDAQTGPAQYGTGRP